MGNGLGWSSPALPNIECKYDNETNEILPDDQQPIKWCLDKEEQRWVGSLLCIGALIASQVYIRFNIGYIIYILKVLNKNRNTFNN